MRERRPSWERGRLARTVRKHPKRRGLLFERTALSSSSSAHGFAIAPTGASTYTPSCQTFRASRTSLFSGAETAGEDRGADLDALGQHFLREGLAHRSPTPSPPAVHRFERFFHRFERASCFGTPCPAQYYRTLPNWRAHPRTRPSLRSFRFGFWQMHRPLKSLSTSCKILSNKRCRNRTRCTRLPASLPLAAFEPEEWPLKSNTNRKAKPS